MSKFHIVSVQPPGYQHGGCLREITEGLAWALQELGHAVAIGDNTLDPAATNIVLGAHLLSEAEALALPPTTIVYNLEQLGSAELPAWYPALASRVRVWEYSELNLPYWSQVSTIMPVSLVPVGHATVLDRISSAPEQDIDVLFYGSMNERRKRILVELEAAHIKVHHAFGVYGEERDALIARSKVILNIHFYESKVFEIVRVSYLLTNGKAVVTEPSPDLGRLAGALAVFEHDDLVQGCLDLLANENARKVLEFRAKMLFREYNQAALLEPALKMLDVPLLKRDDVPRRLNLGSGKDWREDCLNIDINDYWRPDAVLDISQPLPETLELLTERFGPVSIDSGWFDEILANDVLEHIPNLTAAMTVALRLLRPGGIFNIHVPYDLSYGAWQDPTHVRAFNERSWLYYTEWFWYLGWTEARFHVHKLDFILSPLGESLKNRLSGEELIRTPRAVDSMRAHLRKQILTSDEAQFVAKYLKRPERSLKHASIATGVPAFEAGAMALSQ